MIDSTGRVWLGFLLSVAAAGALAGRARGQTPGGDGLAAFVPKDALVFVERRGHAAVRAAMESSNFGLMAADEAIGRFVSDSRVHVGKQIVKSLFDLKEPADIAARQKQLHEVVEAFWHQPAGFCLVWGKENSDPSAVFLCATGPYRASCRKALEELMKIDVPPEGVAGMRQAFTHRKGEVVWKGVVKHESSGVLPKTPEEQAEALNAGHALLVCWVDDLLVMATSLAAADAMSGMLSVTAPGASLAGDKTYQAVAARTSVTDWAFRWHVAVETLTAGPPSRREERSRRSESRELTALGLDRVVAVGGSEGYADKVVTRRMLVYAPAADVSMRLIRPSGSYQRGLAMLPRGAVVSVAGEIDVDVLVKLIALTSSSASVRQDEEPAEDGEAASRPTRSPASRPGEAPDPMAAAVTRLVQASDGNVAAYILDLSAFVGGGGRNGEFPVGLVMGLKDPAQARQAVEQLARLVPAMPARGGDDEGKPATQAASRPASAEAEVYRGTPIQRTGLAQVALLKDRVVVAFSREALTAALDAALDNTGGLPADGKARALVDLDAPAAMLARFDMAKFAQAFWPAFLRENRGDDFPLVSLPTTEKLVSFLGSEVVLIQAVDGGILLKSRGNVPLLTKMPMAAYYPLFFMMRF